MISRLKLISSSLFLATAALSLLMTNCDNVKLSLMPKANVSVSATASEICAVAPSESQRLTKIMFLVDMSGSNLIGNVGEGIPTDPDKSYRYNTIKNFVDTHSSNSQIYYGMIVFQGTTATSLVNDASGNPAFSNDSTQMYAALTQFITMTDSDNTPHKAALTLATQTIGHDRIAVIAAQQQAFYSVALISDGVPTDYGTPIVDESQIDSDVHSLIVQAGSATLSTVYYGPMAQAQDLDAAARLLRMSQDGNGNFVNTNIQGRDIPMTSILAYNETEAWTIRKFFVTNVTTAPCDDGTMGADSDADGLCDQDEIAYNKKFADDPIMAPLMAGASFNPVSRNSFGNMYNDYINYRAMRFGENFDGSCTTSTSSSGDLLNDCEKGYLKALTPAGPTALWTQQMGLNGDPYNFDSDGDGYTDYVELTYARDRSAALNFNNTAQTVQGFSMSQILDQHRHPMNPSESIPYDGALQFSRVNELGQNCYTYNQTVLPLVPTLAVNISNAAGFPQLAHARNENVILLYYIQTPEIDPNGPGEIHYTFQKMTYGTSGFQLNLDTSSYNVYKPLSARVAQPILTTSQ